MGKVQNQQNLPKHTLTNYRVRSSLRKVILGLRQADRH